MKRLVAVAVAAVMGIAASVAAAPGDPTDLKVSKSAEAETVTVGETVTYTIKAENLGPEVASGVTITDSLPKGLEFGSATSTQGSCTPQGQKVVCSTGTLEAGPTAKVSSVTVTLGATARESGTVTNTATVSSAERDPAAANDSASATVRVLERAPVATCRGAQATLVGTAAAETLNGTDGPDVIVARGGGDVVFASAGRDIVCAGSGSDRVVAGSAADRVFGAAGRDRLFGRGGPDLLRGNAGNDLLRGNAGADRLRGNRGIDLCRGGAGLDAERGCEI